MKKAALNAKLTAAGKPAVNDRPSSEVVTSQTGYFGMSIFQTFSKRKKALLKTGPDVYRYDVILEPLRIQILQTWYESIENPQNYNEQAIEDYYEVATILRKEWGVLTLMPDTSYPHDKQRAYVELFQRFLTEKDPDKVLDIIELGLLTLDMPFRGRGWIDGQNAGDVADAAIDEINARFREHAIGYRYSDQQIIRVDSDLTHEEIVKPALTVLRDPTYKGAQAEFLKAHGHYRKGDYSDALVECCKAFESTMKIICTKRKWPIDKNATASTLVKACLDNGLIPAFWQGHISGLKNILESAIPTPRNKLGGHGAGSPAGHEVSDELAGYVINMTAATILFLTEAERKLK